MIPTARLIPALTLMAALSLTACSSIPWLGEKEEPRLEGKRIPLLELQRGIDVRVENAAVNTPVLLPAPASIAWSQSGSAPSHAPQNLDFNNAAPKKIWTASVGKGSRRGLPLTAQPVVGLGHVYTLDTNSTVKALTLKDGKATWERMLRPKGEDEPVIGGGVAFHNGIVYATTGYRMLYALDASNGKTLWTAGLPAPTRAAPTVASGRVFVATMNNQLSAFNANDGRFLWDYNSIEEQAGLVGAAAPAANETIVVPAFSSGEVPALRVENGALAWSDMLTPVGPQTGDPGISDVRAPVVIDRGYVFAISYGGRLNAIDERTGERVWTQDIGGVEMPLVSGNTLYVLSNEAELVALDRESGAIRWLRDMPAGDDDPITWAGPILASGRLFITSSVGYVVEIDAVTGETVRNWEAEAGVKISPVISNGILFLLDEKGRLTAYR